MDSTIYLIAQLMIFLLVFGLIGAILFGLRHAFYVLKVDKKKGETLVLYIRTGLVFWLLISALLAWYDFFADFENFLPKLLIVLLPPCCLVIYLAFFSKSFQNILKAIPEKWLIRIQMFRILSELLLWLGCLGSFVPIQMTFQGFNQDIIVGLTAPMAAALFFRKGRRRKLEAFLWNTFGIALLINVLAISLLSAPGPLNLFSNEPIYALIAYFPFIWIPAFVIPFAFAMHLFSIRKLIL